MLGLRSRKIAPSIIARTYQYLLIGSFGAFSWLGFMVTHELGHPDGKADWRLCMAGELITLWGACLLQ
jgi:hypothetical protein